MLPPPKQANWQRTTGHVRETGRLVGHLLKSATGTEAQPEREGFSGRPHNPETKRKTASLDKLKYVVSFFVAKLDVLLDLELDGCRQFGNLVV